MAFTSVKASILRAADPRAKSIPVPPPVSAAIGGAAVIGTARGGGPGAIRGRGGSLVGSAGNAPFATRCAAAALLKGGGGRTGSGNDARAGAFAGETGCAVPDAGCAAVFAVAGPFAAVVPGDDAPTS